MTLKTQLTIDLEFTSSCSEADLHAHVQNIVGQIKHNAQNIPKESWNSRIHTGWDESYRVDSYAKISETPIS